MRRAARPGASGTATHSGPHPGPSRWRGPRRRAWGRLPGWCRAASLCAAISAIGCTPPPGTATGGAAPQLAAAGRHYEFRPIVCDTLPVTADTVDDTVYVTVNAPVHARALPPGYIERVMDALRAAYVPPHPLAFPVYSAVPGAGAPESPAVAGGHGVLRSAVAAEVEFTLGDTGLIRGRVSTSSLSPAFDRSLVDAPVRADSLHLLPPRTGPTGLYGPVRFYATILSNRPSAGPWAPLFMVRVPQWADSRPAEPVTTAEPATEPGTAPIPQRGDSVVVQIVIDEHGQPMLSTFRLVEAHYLEFARAAVKRLESTIYRPASIDGCAVKGIAELRYSFPVAGG